MTKYTLPYFFFIVLGVMFHGETSAAPLAVVDKPIDFSEHRIELTRQYRKDHYDIDTLSIDIVPRMIVIHWTALDTLEKSFNAFKNEELSSVVS